MKLSLFDVSSSDNPMEVDHYALDEFWSEVENNHHAFLKDDKHQIFLIPGSKGAYIFSYQGDKLTLVKTIQEPSVKRALYINDYLYIISDSKIVVLDETNWNRVSQLVL